MRDGQMTSDSPSIGIAKKNVLASISHGNAPSLVAPLVAGLP
jgi:hypothetical protein